MSAPKDAYPIGDPSTAAEKEANPLPNFKCMSCGHVGNGYALLGVDDEETLWCPICESSAWYWL